ncbi:MAG: CatB-related O-acetyltransferase [Faecalibacterium sp.]
MFLSRRRMRVLLDNIISIPWKRKHGVAISAILQNATVDNNVKIHSKAKFYRSRIGAFSYIGPNSFVADSEIGKYTSISQDCYIGGANHPINWVGTSLSFYCTRPEEEGLGFPYKKKYFNTFQETHIGNDVWIGARVIVLAGVTIGDGAVIGAGSVVTKDVGSYEIWAGNPARKIRDRFPENQKRELQKISWWNMPSDRLNTYMDVIDNPSQFIERIKSDA